MVPWTTSQQVFPSEELVAGEGNSANLEEPNSRDGVKASGHKWSKCISAQGVYTERRITV